MNKRILAHPDLKEIIESFLMSRPKYQGGYLNPFNVDFDKFIADNINKKESYEDLAKKLQALLPSVKVTPSGVNIRSTTKNVEKKLKEFFNVYKKTYTEDMLLKAVTLYGRIAADRKFEMVSPLNYALMKDGNSIIASLCEEKEEVKPVKQYSNDWL